MRRRRGNGEGLPPYVVLDAVVRVMQIERMSGIRKICVYCGSGPGKDPVYAKSAALLGQDLARNGIGLVYGGGSLGLMGIVARSVLESGGHVTGIIPQFLKEREQMLQDAQEVIVTRDMHERKMAMFERADAFVALPGGVGTLEETVEMTTWAQLGQHTKPIVLVNVAGFWAPFINLIEHMREQEFIRPGLDVPIDVADRVEDVLPTVRARAARYVATR
jgi:hypothetical protein